MYKSKSKSKKIILIRKEIGIDLESHNMKALLQINDLRFLNRGPYDIVLHEKQIICLSGASGAGKSLLLRAICDLEPSEGTVTLNGTDRNEISASEWRKQVTWLPAESLWWYNTVIEHFKIAPDDNHLKLLNLDSTILQSEVYKLSTGEKQRLAILRVLQNKPQVLLLDEPTSGLDPKNALASEKLLQDYVKDNGFSAILVSHDKSQAQRLGDIQLEMSLDGSIKTVQ